MKDIEDLPWSLTNKPIQGIRMENGVEGMSGVYPNCDFSCSPLALYSQHPCSVGEGRYISDFLSQGQNAWQKQLEVKEVCLFWIMILEDI